ncbi:MAG: 2-oxoglutarate dehydrogenase E1 component [Bacteroidetes bacterium]|uniref:2-oxoglutarate dehydrogenase E1 component n=1 Tax=Phnomibacter sp. TaxID=2836217 RepID=UPI002FDDB3B6|nr:2-oxoglutarate dehydrogenase E1 component [Bacteroidota bacterium]
MKDFSYITSQHPQFIENQYNDFVANPGSVDPELRKFFEGFDFAMSSRNAGKTAPASNNGSSADWKREIMAYRMILGYRNKGHLLARTNPIRDRINRGANIELSFYGFSEADLETTFQAGQFIGLGATSLRNIYNHLEKCYANHVGWEFKYISDQKKVDWLTNEIEIAFHRELPTPQKRRILEKLNQAVLFEKFLHTKYIGQKRFSLEGGETSIAALDQIITTAADHGVDEVVIGMAHRGRLNVLANIMGKTYEQIFSEFEGTAIPDTTMGSGDVKYHLGFGSQPTTANGKTINLKLAPNPSHLEAVNPVVEGFCRAKADAVYNSQYDHVLPILIHGDASIAGQGIVYEVLQMSKLDGYETGGTIHFVINNQIGFTTDFTDARSSDYCTSLAAAVQAPVFHVNGDDAEAVVKAVDIATRYRQEFNCDVFVDMVCYRRHGHNEGDDPKFTQPGLYAKIDKHPNPREVYTQYLLQTGDTEAQALAKDMEKKFWNDLQERLDNIKQNPLPYTYQKPEEWWRELHKATEADFEQSPETAISRELLQSLFTKIMNLPEGFKAIKKVEKLLADKTKLFDTEQKIDWATGELLAYASICQQGYDVRMSGQDVRRGTFSHRHAVLRDEQTDAYYNRLEHISDNQGKFRIYNSLLSEYAVLGFEYGYAMANPHALVLWEAQFGDFVNGAQTMIDQFISGAEQKWHRMNGVTLLLPHGYEGQGPEHSSARMERFLQACAEYNMVVTNITTAANLFHALRRQITWSFRKPLVNFSPKANLRYPGTYSHVDAFTQGGFQEVIDDAFISNATDVKKVLFCSGKIYFELLEKQQAEGRNDVAVVRLEQIYPLPHKQLDALHKKYKNATWYWVQEEPMNMGAASFLKMNLHHINFGIISRKASAATATGYGKVHAKEQSEIIEKAFSI